MPLLLRPLPGRTKYLLTAALTTLLLMLVVAMSSSVSSAQAHMTCQRDDLGRYTADGLNHIHGAGTELWQVNTYKSSYGGPGAYLAWQTVSFYTFWNVVEYQGEIWCPGY